MFGASVPAMVRHQRNEPVEKPEELRRLAEWYRSMAEVGHSDDCGWRQRFADYLEGKAAEIESRDSAE